MKSMRRVFVFLALALSGNAWLAAMPAGGSEEARAAHALIFGRPLAASSAAQASSGAAVETVESIAARFRKTLSDAAAQQAVAEKAFVDSLGRLPQDGEIAKISAAGSYAELVASNVRWLEQNPQEYRGLLDRAYRHVARRGIYEEEFAYWKPYGVLPYFLVVAALDDWARRNQPGLMVTAGTPTVSINSIYLHTVRLSPKVAEQARHLIGLPTVTTDYASFAESRTIVAPSATKLLAGGGIHFVAVGAEDLLTANPQ